MGKIKDEIAYLKSKKIVKEQYLGLNFERLVLLLTAAIMGYDMKQDSMGDITITSLPIDDRKPRSTKLSFDLGSEGFDPQNNNLLEVQTFFKQEIERFLAKDKPFPSFYEAYHTLMRDFYTERAADDNNWQYNNARNLLLRSSKNLETLFNERPDIHSMSKNIVFYSALCTLKHYLDMPKWKTYNSPYENCYPVNLFKKQTKSMKPIYIGMEIDLCDKFRKFNAPISTTNPEDIVYEETMKGIARCQYNSAVDYMQLGNKIAIDIAPAGDENFWHTRRLRQYFKGR